MSYARLGCEDSDVYVYLDVGGFFNCCFCSFQSDSYHARFKTEMIKHLEKHRENGDTVPDSCFEQLKEDEIEDAHDIIRE